MNAGPLAGIRILEVGVMLAGPYATMLLADLGAEVIKIEPPDGEISRQLGDAYFASLNRNKQSICIDLRSEAGQKQLGELAAKSHALLVNMKPSAIRRLGLTYDALKKYNEKIVCVALTGFGMDGGDDPAFDYVIQAGTGVAEMTGDPDGPPTLPGYSAADNSTGLTAALGLVSQIVSGRGGQVEVSLRDAVMSQLNYKASAWLNDGVAPKRYPNGAHSYYVPAQLFPTADGYLAMFITHDAFWRLFATEAGISGFPTMAERSAQRDEVLAVVARGACHRHGEGLGGATTSARYPGRGGAQPARRAGGTPRGHRDGGGVPAGAQRDTDLRLRARIPTGAANGRARSLVLDGHRLRIRHALTGEDVPLGHLVVVQSVVDAHRRLALDELGHARTAVTRLAAERRRQTRASRAFQQGLVRDAVDRRLLPVEQDRHGPLDGHLTPPSAIEILLLRE